MHTLFIDRNYFKDCTTGVMTVLGLNYPIWHTMEKPDLDNKPFESCIPEGEYIVKPYSSKKYPDVWEVQDVDGRTLILFHWGNWEHDVKGCIAVGMGAGYIHYNGKPKKAIYSSRSAIRQMKEILGYPSMFKLIIRGNYYVR